jgi:death-on-curing protein
MKRISKKQILLLHEEAISQTGGMLGLRDENLLDSSLFAPFCSFDGVSPYPTSKAKVVILA